MTAIGLIENELHVNNAWKWEASKAEGSETKSLVRFMVTRLISGDQFYYSE